MKILRVNRNLPGEHIHFGDGMFHRDVILLGAREVPPGAQYERLGEFFLIDDRDVDVALEMFARANPGCDVEIYTMEKSGQCPAGDFVARTVTKDGKLPA